jgi:putative FmdB family regulatory protein
MPIYEYQCKACGHALEAIQKISEEPLKFCPECGQPHLTKLVSAAGFRLKGGGWYETDFKTKNDKKKNLAGEHKSSSGKSESKSESKPAASKPSASES